ncbi:MAG: hypothetical protein ACJ76U_03590 [Gaiellaceae bacterium]|jgi:hypothetical protein
MRVRCVRLFVTAGERYGEPRNWVVQLRPDGSHHLAPDAWLQPGFFEGVVDSERNGAAARAILERELAIIVDDS